MKALMLITIVRALQEYDDHTALDITHYDVNRVLYFILRRENHVLRKIIRRTESLIPLPFCSTLAVRMTTRPACKQWLDTRHKERAPNTMS